MLALVCRAVDKAIRSEHAREKRNKETCLQKREEGQYLSEVCHADLLMLGMDMFPSAIQWDIVKIRIVLVVKV